MGPCLCGDPYCAFCGDPSLAAYENAEEELLQKLSDEGFTLDAMVWLIRSVKHLHAMYEVAAAVNEDVRREALAGSDIIEIGPADYDPL